MKKQHSSFTYIHVRWLVSAGIILSALFLFSIRGVLLGELNAKLQNWAQNKGLFWHSEQLQWPSWNQITADKIEFRTSCLHTEFRNVRLEWKFKHLFTHGLIPNGLFFETGEIVLIEKQRNTISQNEKPESSNTSATWVSGRDISTILGFIPAKMGFKTLSIQNKSGISVGIDDFRKDGPQIVGKLVLLPNYYTSKYTFLSGIKHAQISLINSKKEYNNQVYDQIFIPFQANLIVSDTSTQASIGFSNNPKFFNHLPILENELTLPDLVSTLTLDWGANSIRLGQKVALNPSDKNLNGSWTAQIDRAGNGLVEIETPAIPIAQLIEILSGERLPGTERFIQGTLPSMHLTASTEGKSIQNLTIHSEDTQQLKASAPFITAIQQLKQGMEFKPEGSAKTINIQQTHFLKASDTSLPSYFIPALLLSEDANFNTHHGFDLSIFKHAISENLAERRFSRGGSTLTMQLVRNLWLSKNKTLSRKLDEMILTHVIEQDHLLSKSEILDIYLQLIEWGPEIYGLDEAADFYFAKDPSQLTPDETLFLCAVIPNPKQFHQLFQPEGMLSDFGATYFESMRWMLVAEGHLPDSVLDNPLPDVSLLTGKAKASRNPN